MKITKTDQFGVVEIKPLFKIVLGFTLLYIYIALAAIGLHVSEHLAIGANITNYEDAFWVLQMAASTIGFGDFYPVSEVGRWIVVSTFYVGMTLVGYIVMVLGDVMTGFTDASVQNRELRKQNAEIIALLKAK